MFIRFISYTYSHAFSRSLSSRSLNGRGFPLLFPKTRKTRYVVEPSIVKSKDSMVILDLNGGIFKDTKGILEKKGYKIKVLDLLHPKKSLCYNPFQYIKDEYDVISLAKFLMQYTAVENIPERDSFSPYFEEAEEALLIALINYRISSRKPRSTLVARG